MKGKRYSWPSYLPLWLLVMGGLLLPTPWNVQAQEDDEFVDPFDESGFDFSEVRGAEPWELPLGEDPATSEVLPMRRAVADDEPQMERPTEAVELRFRFGEPMRFDVNTTSRMGFEDRPGLRQIYQSGMAVEYHPVTQVQRSRLRSWPMEVEAAEDADSQGQLVVASVSRFSGSFDEPHELSDSARTHQILKDAAFSFRISERGLVSDIAVHPPTNPLARSSMEELVRIMAASHPVLPEQAVEPGDTWSHTIEVESDDSSVVRAQQIDLRFEFVEWARCGRRYCARIDVEQDIKAAGRYLVRHLETRSSTAGSGDGWFLLDVDRGRIVRSQWNVDTQGTTNTRRRKEDSVEEVLNIAFNLSVSTTIRLIEQRDPGYRLVPTTSGD